jgi:D-alanyl-lipoteichoic acid acyltransferase DltB (MBOAT superfamily)
MLFTSYSFIVFLAALVAAYWLVPKKWQWGLLLIGSYVFYAFSGLENLIFILATTFSSFLAACLMESNRRREEDYISKNKEALQKEERKAYKAKEKKKQWRLLLLCLLINIGILAVLKYTNFAISNWYQKKIWLRHRKTKPNSFNSSC